MPFNTTSFRFPLREMYSIGNVHFEQIVDRIYPAELELNKTNSSDTKAPFLDLNLFISNGTVATKIYDKRDDFDFDIVNFPFLDGDVLRIECTYLNLSVSLEYLLALVTSCRNRALTAKLLKQGYHYDKLRMAFSKFYRRHSGLDGGKYHVSLKKLPQQGISESEFCGDLVYRFRKKCGEIIFFRTIQKAY